MLEPIKVMPEPWGNHLTNWFNNDLVKPTPRPIPVRVEHHAVQVPVMVFHDGVKVKASKIQFYRAMGLNV